MRRHRLTHSQMKGYARILGIVLAFALAFGWGAIQSIFPRH
jgi:hypothetical protein